MRRLASVINILRAQRQRAVALAIGAAMTAGGSTALLPTTNDVHAQALSQGLNNSTSMLTADRSSTAVGENTRPSDQEGGRPHLVVAHQPAPPPPPPITQVPWGSTDLGEEILRYRIRERISSRSNVAVFEYLDHSGQKKILTLGSKRGVGHAERLIAKTLQDLKIPNENVLRIYSELEPCPDIPFGYCKTMITKGSPAEKGRGGGGGGGGYDPDPPSKPLGPFPNAKVSYNFEYGDTHESRERGQKQLRERVEKWEEAARARASAAFQAPDSTGAASGTLVDTLSQQSTSSLGGIDFSSLELRYLSDRRSGDNDDVQYAFTALPATGDQPTNAGLHAVNQASDAFFVWLALPTSKFTVNLNPDEPNRIIDTDFGRTDAGRVLLEADLQLKKTVAQLINPDTPLGAQFWEALKGEGDERCLSFRQWIVPAPASVLENSEELYILDAPLSVKMETEYFQNHGLGDTETACRQQEKSIEEHNEAVFRTMILAHLEQTVNHAPEYAELRRVYLSRVAAEWYRDRNAHKHTTFAGLIDRGDITPWVSTQPWSPQEVFDRYVESFTKGEFNVTRQTNRDGDVIETSTYVFGGVDFTNISFRNLSAGDVQRNRPDLLKTVDQAFDNPAIDQRGKIWLGSTSGQGSGGRLPVYLFLVGIGAVAATAVVVAVRARGWLWLSRRDSERADPTAGRQ